MGTKNINDKIDATADKAKRLVAKASSKVEEIAGKTRDATKAGGEVEQATAMHGTKEVVNEAKHRIEEQTDKNPKST